SICYLVFTCAQNCGGLLSLPLFRRQGYWHKRPRVVLGHYRPNGDLQPHNIALCNRCGWCIHCTADWRVPSFSLVACRNGTFHFHRRTWESSSMVSSAACPDRRCLCRLCSESWDRKVIPIPRRGGRRGCHPYRDFRI